MDAATKIKNGSRDVTTNVSGTFCRLKAGTSYDQRVYQFEVPVFTHNKNMKGDEKCRN